MFIGEIYTSLRKRKQKVAVNKYQDYIRYLEEQHMKDQKILEYKCTANLDDEKSRQQAR